MKYANAEAIAHAQQVAKDYINCVGDWSDEKAVGKAIEYMGEIYHLLDDALLKNCDVGTADEHAERFETFCSLHHLPKGKGCYSCPALPTKSPTAFHRDACRSNWLKMPYKEDGVK